MRSCRDRNGNDTGALCDRLVEGFARQARADLNSYKVSCITPSIPLCHRYHFLQMACEKLAKAHLCTAGSNPMELQASHVYAAKVIPIVIRYQLTQLGPTQAAKYRWVADGVRPLAREIELLSPSVDDADNRPANCEYPWLDSTGTVRAPADDEFPNMSQLNSHMGTVFLKLVQNAILRLSE